MKEAIILAGGLARRFGGECKWMTPINTTTLAQLQIDWLKRQGIERILVTLNRRFMPVETDDVRLRWELPRLPVEFIREEGPIGDEGGLKRALEYLRGEDALVMNCDVLCPGLEIAGLLPPPTLVLVHPRSPWGVFGDVGWFEEKPILSQLWVSAGIYYLPKSLGPALVENGELARNIVPKLIREGQMKILRHTGKWMAVETGKDAQEAVTFLGGVSVG